MVSHGRSASPIHFASLRYSGRSHASRAYHHFASLRYSGRSHASRAYHASFCSLFDPRFRFAPPRTAGAKLFAPYTGRALMSRFHIKRDCRYSSPFTSAIRMDRIIPIRARRCVKENRDVKRCDPSELPHLVRILNVLRYIHDSTTFRNCQLCQAVIFAYLGVVL